VLQRDLMLGVWVLECLHLTLRVQHGGVLAEELLFIVVVHSFLLTPLRRLLVVLLLPRLFALVALVLHYLLIQVFVNPTLIKTKTTSIRLILKFRFQPGSTNDD